MSVGLWNFKDGGSLNARFLPKNQHAQRKFFQKNPTMTYGWSKIRRHFRNKSRSILKLSKKVFYKNWSPKLIFLNEFFF